MCTHTRAHTHNPSPSNSISVPAPVSSSLGPFLITIGGLLPSRRAARICMITLFTYRFLCTPHFSPRVHRCGWRRISKKMKKKKNGQHNECDFTMKRECFFPSPLLFLKGSPLSSIHIIYTSLLLRLSSSCGCPPASQKKKIAHVESSPPCILDFKRKRFGGK